MGDIWEVYGDCGSGNCYKVGLVLRLTGRDYRWHEVNVVNNETRNQGFLSKNPNGKVPLLQLPDGRYLAESNAIMLYLAEGTSLIPGDDYQRALMYQWLFFEQYSHEPYIAVVRYLIHMAGLGDQEAERIVSLREKGYQALSVMEQTLKDQPFLVGDHFTLADIALYAYTHVAHEGDFDLTDYPNIQAWLQRIADLPEYVAMSHIDQSLVND